MKSFFWLPAKVDEARLELLAAEQLAVELGRIGHRHVHLQRRPLDERLQERGHLLLAGRVERGRARVELDEIDLRAAAEEAADEREWRGRNLGKQPDEGLPDEGPEPELRVVEAAGHRQVDVDDAVPVLQERNRELERQGDGVGALDLLAELELVDDEFLLGVELAVLDVVGDVDRELALLDLVAREAARVRRDGGHVHARELEADVREERRRKQVHLAVDGRGRIAVHLALEVELGARGRVGRKARRCVPFSSTMLDRIVGLDPEVGEVRASRRRS